MSFMRKMWQNVAWGQNVNLSDPVRDDPYQDKIKRFTSQDGCQILICHSNRFIGRKSYILKLIGLFVKLILIPC